MRLASGPLPQASGAPGCISPCALVSRQSWMRELLRPQTRAAPALQVADDSDAAGAPVRAPLAAKLANNLITVLRSAGQTQKVPHTLIPWTQPCPNLCWALSLLMSSMLTEPARRSTVSTGPKWGQLATAAHLRRML